MKAFGKGKRGWATGDGFREKAKGDKTPGKSNMAKSHKLLGMSLRPLIFTNEASFMIH